MRLGKSALIDRLEFSKYMDAFVRSHQTGRLIKIFGAALDPLPSPERLNLKLAYLDHIKKTSQLDKNSDPYDATREFLKRKRSFSNGNVWLGKVEIESWLTPKPTLEDIKLLNVENVFNFLRKNGCWSYALRVSDYVNNKILPSRPAMIGVDHSLTGGVIMALSNYYNNLNVIVLDAHFDILRYQDMNSLSQSSAPGNYYSASFNKTGEIKFYECGNFIFYLINKKIVRPKNLWVLGVQDEMLESLGRRDGDKEGEPAQIEEYRRMIKKGVHLISKTDLVFEKFLLELNGPIYLSIDMDVGSLSSIYSARFMNCVGLARDEFIKCLHNLSSIFQKSGFPVVGLDIMEMDIHLLEASGFSCYQDYSREIIEEIFKAFLN